jgi:hypothetical protein
MCTAYHCPRASLDHLGYLNGEYFFLSLMETMTWVIQEESDALFN